MKWLQLVEKGWRWTCGNMRRLLALALCAGSLVFAPCLSSADDWGCRVLLCLSNPGGPEQYNACVPPIERLWSALRHGDPFPTCDFDTGSTPLFYDPSQSAALSLLRTEDPWGRFGGGR
jgi:hypothetical protein